MHSLGKEIRLKRLIRQETNSSVICALDHGMTSPQFLSGLRDTGARVREAQAGGANVFMLGKGFTRLVVDELNRDTSFAMLLSASAAQATQPNIIVEVGQVEEALRLGADAVVVYVALTGDNEPRMIEFLARVGGECERLGMPFIAEAEFPSAYATLESLTVDADGVIRPQSGETALFIRPGHTFQLVSGLVTNFHLPRSSLLMLVSALAGRAEVLGAYRAAVAARYRFYSYGDAMVIL